MRCLAHIINLAAQDALKALNGIGPENEEEVLEDDNPIETVAKVIKINLFLIFKLY